MSAWQKKNLSRLAISTVSFSPYAHPAKPQPVSPAIFPPYTCAKSWLQQHPPHVHENSAAAATFPPRSRKFSSSNSRPPYLPVCSASRYTTLLLFFFTACNRNLQPTKISPFHPFRFFEVKHFVWRGTSQTLYFTEKTVHICQKYFCRLHRLTIKEKENRQTHSLLIPAQHSSDFADINERPQLFCPARKYIFPPFGYTYILAFSAPFLSRLQTTFFASPGDPPDG